MEDPEIDRILAVQFSAHDEILPSSGFASSVMDTVRSEASVPAPIPFPWRWALPGIAVAALVLGVVMALGVSAILQISRGALSARVAAISPSLPWPAWQGTAGATVAWTVLSLVVALVSVMVSIRVAAGKA
ncbi:MAG: hypothetical protein ABSD39_01170 [Terriglobales bacterium]|jgi:hypothetical protein